MAETTNAGSSPAEQEDVFRGEHVGFDEFSRFRQNGELPDRFKPAGKAGEAAPADAPEETVESEGEEPESESEPESEEEEAQEPPQKPVSPAQKRILQLLAEKKELQRKLEAAQPPQAQPEAPPQPLTRAKPKVDDQADGKPRYATYEDYVEDLADWKAEQQVARYRQEQAQQEALRALKAQLDDARGRYEDADDVIFPAAETIRAAQMPVAVKEVFAQSEYFPDLCYVVGSDPDELKKFVSLAQTNPRAALARVFEYERGIRDELTRKTEDGGKAPETRKTSAPKPPVPVNGGSSRAFDVNDETLSADEWARKRNEQLKRRGRA